MPTAVALTVEEACEVLDPALTPHQLRAIIRALHIQPSGWRHSGRAGHPVAVYSAATVFRLHGALAPFIRNDVA